MPKPMPKPRMNRNTSGSQNASCTCRVDMRKKPTAAMALEATSIHLYFPVRAAMKPLAVDVMKMPDAHGHAHEARELGAHLVDDLEVGGQVGDRRP